MPCSSVDMCPSLADDASLCQKEDHHMTASISGICMDIL